MATDPTTEPGTVDTELSAGVKKAPIGTVKDALKTKNTIASKSVEETQKAEAAKTTAVEVTEQPITSLAMLHDWHRKNGTEATHDEVKQVRELEKAINEEGAKHVRKSSAHR